MSQILLANWRATLHYVVDGFPHISNHYCDALVDTGSLVGYSLLDRDGATHIHLEDAAQRWGDLIGSILYSTLSSVGSVLLEQRSGSVWNPVVSSTPVSVSMTGFTYNKASQMTTVLRDTAFKKVKDLAMESVVLVGKHGVAVPSSAFVEHAYLLSFTDGFTGPSDPYRWIKSRGNRYLATVPFVGYTTDLNNKIRRRRGIA